MKELQHTPATADLGTKTVVEHINQLIRVTPTNDTDTFTSVPSVKNIVTLTQLEYDNMGAENHDANTWYLIIG